MLIRYIQLALAFVKAYGTVWFEFPKLDREQKLRRIQQWSSDTLRLLGVELHVETTDPMQPSLPPARLLVSNHVSWLDILVIQALQPSVFVAKQEVRSWPVIGGLAQACGVVFVDRGSPAGARRMVDEVVQALRYGYQVAGFPEGTSSAGQTVQPFHANIFEAAIVRGTPVQTMALQYRHAENETPCHNAAFIDDMGFVESLHQIMRASRIKACVRLGGALQPDQHSRRTLAHISHQNVSHQLMRLTSQTG